MIAVRWLATVALTAIAAPVCAQGALATPATDLSPATPPASQSSTAATASVGPKAAAEAATGEILVTATRRPSPLADVPIAVSVVTQSGLQNSGASDIRQLNQLVPSLYTSSDSSEAAGATARIRGIGTVGDNPGLESSVATFIDGVYRSRSGIGLTELGPVDRIEVLNGPQGTLFGRNASAGLINIVTAQPSFDESGYADATFGNYDTRRFGLGFTGPVTNNLAYRFDGVYYRRDGFIRDLQTGDSYNNRDRYLLRGKLLWKPTDRLSVLVIGDYTNRNENCCVGVYLPSYNVSRGANGQLVYSPPSVAGLINSITSVVPGAGHGIVDMDTFSRETALTPGRSFRSDVTDWGGSAEVNYAFDHAKLTSITAYRQYKYIKGQDADFGNLDILSRPSDGSGYTSFHTFSQELRLQGEAFHDRLDWLVGGYFADERLALNDNLSYGADYNQYAADLVGGASPALAAFPLFGFQNLNGFSQALLGQQLATNPAFAGIPAAARPLIVNAIASQVANTPLSNTGELDKWRQHSTNFAFFTHNIVNLTDKLSLTLGARYTHEDKSLDANLSSNTSCGLYAANIQRLRGLAAQAAANPGGNGGLNPAIAALAAALANQVLSPLAGLPCVVNSTNGQFSDDRKEGEWTGTAVLGYKPIYRLLTYASYSRGYKAGGFNLDSAPLFSAATLTSNPISSLEFAPEKVDSFELGAKYRGHRFDLNVALFYELFDDFQLNTFNGANFFVTNIQGCKDSLGGTDSDAIPGNSSCGKTKHGVYSRGVELHGDWRPLPALRLDGGYTYAETRFSDNLAGTPDASGNNSLQPALFLLPGSQISNAPKNVLTGAATWTPRISDKLKGLVYGDVRYQSAINTGSDLFPEKVQDGYAVVNARLGLGAANGGWSLELWAQNLFDKDYIQVAFSTPLQGGGSGGLPGTSAAVAKFGTVSNQLFSAFLGDPRTFGVTARTKF